MVNKMKKKIIYIVLVLVFIISCTTQKSSINKDIINSYNAIYLDANEDNDVAKKIKFVEHGFLKYQINFNQKRYDISLLKSITDTIKGDYIFKIDTIGKSVLILKNTKI